jgi:hypothetical protein
MKLRLTFDLNYTPNGVTEAELRQMLAQIAIDAINDGRLTGDTEAAVESYRYTLGLVR